MKKLIEDYQNKLKNIEEILKTSKNSGSINDNEKFTRLKTKKFEYETFITELEHLEVDEKDKYTHGLYVGTRSASQTLIDIMFQVAITITTEPKLRRLNNADLTKWIREQLKASGFETSPDDVSWGTLK